MVDAAGIEWCVAVLVFVVAAAVFGFLGRRNRDPAADSQPPAAMQPPPTTTTVEAVQMASIAVILLDHVTYTMPPEAEAGAEEDCAICLGSFEDGDLCSVMPVCRHEFHRACIAGWLLAYNNTCPLCRAQLDWAAVAENMV